MSACTTSKYQGLMSCIILDDGDLASILSRVHDLSTLGRPFMVSRCGLHKLSGRNTDISRFDLQIQYTDRTVQVRPLLKWNQRVHFVASSWDSDDLLSAPGAVRASMDFHQLPPTLLHDFSNLSESALLPVGQDHHLMN